MQISSLLIRKIIGTRKGTCNYLKANIAKSNILLSLVNALQVYEDGSLISSKNMKTVKLLRISLDQEVNYQF